MKPICTLIILLVSLSVSAQDNPRDILKLSYKAIKSHKGISYYAEFTFKGCDRPDTMQFYANVSLLRMPADKDFGGMIYIAPHDNTYTFYNLQKVYHVDKYACTASLVKNNEWYEMRNGKQVKVKEETKSLGRWTNNALAWHHFLRPSAFKQYLDNADIRRLNDTVINGRRCYEICVKHHADKRNDIGNERTTILYIDENYLIPIFNREWTKNGDTYQYTDFYMQNIEFDTVEETRFSRKQIPDFYRLKG